MSKIIFILIAMAAVLMLPCAVAESNNTTDRNDTANKALITGYTLGSLNANMAQIPGHFHCEVGVSTVVDSAGNDTFRGYGVSLNVTLKEEPSNIEYITAIDYQISKVLDVVIDHYNLQRNCNFIDIYGIDGKHYSHIQY